MGWLEAVLYGLVQGLTEYLPVSSTAHLALLPKFFQTRDPGLAFDVFLHLGTLLATLVYFWREWFAVLGTLPYAGRYFKSQGVAVSSISWKLVVAGTVPALVAGAALNDLAETSFRGNLVIAAALIAGGVLLYLCDLLARREREAGAAGLGDAIWLGVAQCFALVPGVSRSGATITCGRILGFTRTDAAKLSFLLSAPVTAAAAVYELRHWDRVFSAGVELGPALAGASAAFVAGMLAIGGLLKLLKKHGYLGFAVYRILLALVIVGAFGR
ncbi:MAG: hypothetical protein A2583_01915 [Bdellovibrionales bacterium RIFOXYD1_FULL_53_11]|nr:MAG: hypothetical protein A2583_01915 [Bdellovibrionales bacterium RIFOXYD1_FULL_53_11]